MSKHSETQIIESKIISSVNFGDHVQVTCTLCFMVQFGSIPIRIRVAKKGARSAIVQLVDVFARLAELSLIVWRYGMLNLASATSGSQVAFASSNDDKRPPESIIDG